MGSTRQASGKALWQRSLWLLLAALALAIPRLLPAATFGALDLLGDHGQAIIDRGEIADQNFPGSAFFFAEGAFDPVPGTLPAKQADVLALDTGPAAVAAPFRGLTALDQYRATNCLTSAIYYEAANEPDDGQRAVAQVVLNRVRHPAWPNSICGVVYQGSERTDMKCQFTFSCDGAMARLPNAASWARARRVALAALGGEVFAPVGLATHYHTLAVHPVWADSLKPVAVIGAHIFYRWQGNNGTPQAFRVRYLGRETQSGPAPRVWTAPAVAPILPVVPSPYIARPDGFDRLPLAPSPSRTADNLPESTIRPEYRNTGRPLI